MSSYVILCLPGSLIMPCVVFNKCFCFFKIKMKEMKKNYWLQTGRGFTAHSDVLCVHRYVIICLYLPPV